MENAIAENLNNIKRRVAVAAEKSGRAADSVTLVAVSKTKDAETVAEAVRAGALDLGENRVQEWMEKAPKVQHIVDDGTKTPNIRWHLIGHLQRNKVKYIVGKICMIHSVDSWTLSCEIEKRSAEADTVTDVLLQLNPAGEEQKSGMTLAECEEFALEIAAEMPHVRVCGLMAVVPAVDNPEDVRGYFREVRGLFDGIRERHANGTGLANFRHLSMGMTNDFETAIEEGSTMVRVGTAIFGVRN